MRILVLLTQKTPEFEEPVKYPKRIKHRGRVLASIYGKGKYPLSRVASTVAGKRMMKAFDRYGEAKRYVDNLVKDLAKGSQASALPPGQASDALAAFDRLQVFFQSSGLKAWPVRALRGYDCKALKDKFPDLVKNTYRVLLTRGIKGRYVYFMDEETRHFVLSRTEKIMPHQRHNKHVNNHAK